MKEKINLLYYANYFAGTKLNSSSRTGIYFVVYNILKKLKDDNRFNIYLFVRPAYKHSINSLAVDPFLSQFKLVAVNDPSIYKTIIVTHIENMIKSRNILMFIYSLKIVKNCIMYIFSKIYSMIDVNTEYSILRNMDAFFSPQEKVPDVIKKYSHIKQFVFLHDTLHVLFPQYYDNYNWEKSTRWPGNLYRDLNKQTCYFCNSESTRRDFLKLFGSKIDYNKMKVSLLAAANDYIVNRDQDNLNAVLTKYKIPPEARKKYIFSLCILDPRKNLIFTVKCFMKFVKKHDINDLYFYLGGGHWTDFYKNLNQVINDLNKYADRIIQTGYIDDTDLNTFYSNAIFFTYISEYEGFGIPPLEAMQSGTPVITSNNSSLPEVVGDAAIKIDCNSEEQCIKAFETLYFNDELRESYIVKGLERAKLFSWDKTVSIIADTIADAVKHEKNQFAI
ncbi:MAG: glycosyltransferase family 4 protein [Bacteroidales bacterium]|jgi:glycosyltransferase involved in cell wall biosynthesis|nr:glycosyltransferase family 4 protein [Bacteroidales bacterium]